MSGFAFRLWVHAELCPSAMSVWEFQKQKPWVENGGLSCAYCDRLWDQDNIEEARRNEAMEMIKTSIDNGIAAIAWDIGVPEWGLVIGYDEGTKKLATLSITGEYGEMDYAELGKREIPILNVLTITGQSDKQQADIVSGTLAIAKQHLNGEEWCENAKGLAAYPVLIGFFEMEETKYCLSWEMEYCLGTYAALRQYAWMFLDKYNQRELAALYKKSHECWQTAYEIKKSKDMADAGIRAEIAGLLRTAEECERQAVTMM